MCAKRLCNLFSSWYVCCVVVALCQNTFVHLVLVVLVVFPYVSLRRPPGAAAVLWRRHTRPFLVHELVDSILIYAHFLKHNIHLANTKIIHTVSLTKSRNLYEMTLEVAQGRCSPSRPAFYLIRQNLQKIIEILRYNLRYWVWCWQLRVEGARPVDDVVFLLSLAGLG